MRRKDREITDFESIVSFLESCDTIRLGFHDREYPYVVPVSFGMKAENGKINFYIHGAQNGKRKGLAELDNRVCVEADFFGGYTETEIGCSTVYQSFIGFGKIQECFENEKINALELLMKHCGGKKLSESDYSMLAKTCVFKITVDDFSCKARTI